MNWLFKNTVSHEMKPAGYLWLGVLAGALALTACGGGTTASNNAAPAKTATIDLSVVFPEAEAGKSIIPVYTDTIGFAYCRMDPQEPWCDLFGTGATQVLVTRADPKKTIAVSPGLYLFGAMVSNSTDPSDLTGVFDYATTAGEVIEGNNTIRMTFLQGDWTFKTSGGANDPVTLGDGTVLSGFKLRADLRGLMPAAANADKSAFDFNKPLYGAEYMVTLNTSAGALDAGWLMSINQFHSGTNNNNALVGMDYNLTKGCSDPYDEGQCPSDEGDWGVLLINGVLDGYGMYESYGAYALLPAPTLTDGNGNPVDISTYNSTATDGVTASAYLVDYQFGAQTDSLVVVGAAAGKSVVTTNVGTVVDTRYQPVIATNGTGTNRGTWNFDTWVYDPITGQGTLVVDGCLVTGDPSGRNYATCGYLNSVFNPTTGQYEYDMGDYSWGFAPTDPQNLGEYGCTPQTAGYYQPGCIYDMNGDGTVDTGSFQFSHYLKREEARNNVRVHRVTAKGVALPESELTPPAP